MCLGKILIAVFNSSLSCGNLIIMLSIVSPTCFINVIRYFLECHNWELCPELWGPPCGLELAIKGFFWIQPVLSHPKNCHSFCISVIFPQMRVINDFMVYECEIFSLNKLYDNLILNILKKGDRKDLTLSEQSPSSTVISTHCCHSNYREPDTQAWMFIGSIVSTYSETLIYSFLREIKIQTVQTADK